MAVYLIDKIKPKNNGTFGMADTVDIDHSDGRRLDVVLDEIAEKADGGGTAVTALTKRVETAEGKIAAAENALARKLRSTTRIPLRRQHTQVQRLKTRSRLRSRP